MKFQDSSFNSFKGTVGTKGVTHARTHTPTHAPKAICPINFFQSWGNNYCPSETIRRHIHSDKTKCDILYNGLQKCITQTRPCNIQQYFIALKMLIFR